MDEADARQEKGATAAKQGSQALLLLALGQSLLVQPEQAYR
jgi:hypothetical protein